MRRSVAVIAGSVAVSAALVVTYAALGGGRSVSTPARDSCAQRSPHHAEGVQEAIQQIVLATADGAACELGVTREELLLALGSGADLGRFAAKHNLTQQDAERAIRQGLVRSIDDANQRGAIGDTTARLLRGIAERLPIDTMLSVLEKASGLLGS
jgi:hypothetical protein